MNRVHLPLLALVMLLTACDQGGPAPGSEAPSLAQRTYEAPEGRSEAGSGETTEGAARQAYDRPGARAGEGCDALPDAETLRRLLREAPGKGEAGGLAGGRNQWAAVVNRAGVVCAVAVSTEDAAAAWPGSRAIAMAKAYTANAFSSDTTPLSTARLYTLAQPGHSLYGAAAANPFNPDCLGTPDEQRGVGELCGGTIVFGGGVPLYKGNTKVGGLGSSGDTACADHEIAKRIRAAADLDPPKGRGADDIQYSEADGASVYTHPLCVNTWRDGTKIGEEAAAQGY